MKQLKQLIIDNNYTFPESEVVSWCAADTNKNSGIVNTRHYGKIYFYIIKPWYLCPNGSVTIERA